MRKILKSHRKHSQSAVVHEAKQLQLGKEEQSVQFTILSGNLNLKERRCFVECEYKIGRE